MDFPKIDLSSLPVLEKAAGMFGSLSDVATASSDDRVVIIMVYLYETVSDPSLGLF